MPEPSEGSAIFTSTNEDLFGFDADGLEKPEESTESAEATEASGSDDEGKDATGEPEAEPEKPAEEQQGEEPETPPEAAAEAAPEPVPEKFLFADKEYETKEAAEHFYKSYLGQVGAKDRELKDLREQLLERDNQLVKLLQESQQGGQPKEEEKKAEPKKPLTLTDAVDYDLYKRLCEEQGVDYGLQYVLDQQQKVMQGMLEEYTGEKLAPLQQWHEQMAAYNKAAVVFQELADRKDDSGNYVFTEMRESPEFVEKVARYWSQHIPNREEMGVTGVYLAYLAVKDWERYGNSGEPPAPPEPPPEAPAAPPAEPPPARPSASEAFNRLNQQTQQGTNEGVVTGSGLPRPAVGPRDSYQAQIKRELEEAAKSQDALLGFEPA
jgi:hypothetical protein